MSLSRSPRLDEIRRREDEADARKVGSIIAVICALSAFCFVAAIVAMGR